jgi:hypothetical protein
MRSIAFAFVVMSSLSRVVAADIGWEGQLAMRWVNVRYDEGTSWGWGLGARGGATFGRHLAVMIDYSDIGTNAPSGWSPTANVAALGGSVPAAPTSNSGSFTRIGALARYTVRSKFGGTSSGEKSLLARAWILAGVGHEIVLWDAGGRLTRPDLAIGLGGSFGGIGKRSFGDSYFEIQLWIAPRSRSGATTCGGPCDIATPPPPFDRSLVIDWGISFGR